MQFQLTRYEYVKTIEFKTGPLSDLTAIRYFKEEGVTGTFIKKEYRYSWDNSTWTNWNTLTQGNLSAIVFRDQPLFYLEVKYSREGIGSGNIQRWYLFADTTSPTPPTPPVDASIDADTLGGEGPAYYLNRENFFGPYTDLEVSNVVDGSAIGVYSHRVDSSLGTEFFFKRIEGISGIDVTEDVSGKISISFDASVAGNVTYQNPNPTIEAVGGIPDGSTYFAAEKTFAQVMEDMFYPLSYPSLTNPFSTLTDNIDPPDLVIIGSTISLNLRSTLNRGTINPPYGTSGNRSGIGSAVYFQGPDVSTVIGSNPISPYTYNIPAYEVSMGYQTWYSYWDYEEGEMPKDSKGNDYDPPGPLPAGSTTPNSTRFEGVYPIWATTDNIVSTTEQELESMITGDDIEYTLVAEPPFGTDRQKIDIPNIWLAARDLQGVQFLDFQGEWQYFGGSSVTSLTYWSQSSTTHVHNGIVNYTRFTYGDPGDPTIKQGETTIRLKFS